MSAVAAAEERVRGVSARAARDAVLTGAVELARAAAQEVAESPEDVGEHLGTVAEADRLISHRFACTMRGYRGWHWTVTLARVPRGRTATVCEVELLPGDGALLAPSWLPWSERLRPGDVGPGDVLPFRPDDPRLEPGYVPTGDEEQDAVAIEELALARARVLSPQGRDEAAERWYRGSRGPTTRGAVAAAADCGSCGFLVPLQGSLGQVFGVCANEWSPDDGKVVSLDHGCGAHSETDVEPQRSEWPDPDPLVDELHVEIVTLLESAVARKEAARDGAAPTDTAADETARDETVPAAQDEPTPVADAPTPTDTAPEDLAAVAVEPDAVPDDAETAPVPDAVPDDAETTPDPDAAPDEPETAPDPAVDAAPDEPRE
ncbi:MAG: DUF3027 domain-containing protein [Cellulosimicrobium funkei]|uniref:DUF3027 domain-containing protein n=1 Tax=Cellulosimicrobium cellulans TaxID=1710 RepID=A0AAV5P9K5_CELCE|nr:DUF3027 domain-containing protein [Cellulosimicrobium cellulans]QDP76635.1 DUF3027 domain-containing protein [Cellulosimicrobium cellulans]GLY57821.1 hypothetical protein Ccel01_24230 [Cellulosimicrobium cellulans]